MLGFVPDLWRQLAACDVAVVQGGLTTCMELTASRRPFLYVPLRNHFEQNRHVRRRLERYGAGTYLPYEQLVDPDAFCAELLATLDRPVTSAPVETDGAQRRGPDALGPPLSGRASPPAPVESARHADGSLRSISVSCTLDGRAVAAGTCEGPGSVWNPAPRHPRWC